MFLLKYISVLRTSFKEENVYFNIKDDGSGVLSLLKKEGNLLSKKKEGNLPFSIPIVQTKQL